MPSPTRLRPNVDRYRSPVWIPGKPRCIYREIPISTRRWFHRDPKPGNVVAWTFSGIGENFGLMIDDDREGEMAQIVAKALTEGCSCPSCGPPCGAVVVSLPGGRMAFPARIRNALRAKLGKIARLRQAEAKAAALAAMPARP